MNRLVVTAAALIIFAAPLPAVDLRPGFGEGRARAVDAAISSAVPGARVTWDDRIVVTLPDGSRSDVAVPGLIELARPQGPFYVMEIEFSDFVRDAADKLADGSTAPTGHPSDFVVAMQMTATGQVLDQRRGRLDPTSVGSETKKFVLVDESVSLTWPVVQALYWGSYGTADWYGSVRWQAIFNLETMTNYARTPLSLSKTTTATGQNVAEQLAVGRSSASSVRLEGGITEQLVEYPCSFPCFFDGRSLLAAWTIAPPSATAGD